MDTPAAGSGAKSASPIAASGVHTPQPGEPIAIERQRQTTLPEQRRRRVVSVTLQKSRGSGHRSSSRWCTSRSCSARVPVSPPLGPVPGFGVMRSTNRRGNRLKYLLPKPKTPFTAGVTATEAIGRERRSHTHHFGAAEPLATGQSCNALLRRTIREL